MQTKPQTYSKLYNQSTSFFELISDKHQVKTIIEDIKADKAITIELDRFIYQTSFYPKLENKLKSQRAELAGIDDYVERLKLNEQIQETEKEVRKYKIGILETSVILYELREESLTDVKQSFFSGNIIDANKLLSSSGLWQAQEYLIQRAEIEQKLDDIYEKLIDNANEYLVKAQLTALNLDIQIPEDRLQKAIEFFERGKVSAERSRNEAFVGRYYFDYALFLQQNNSLRKSEEIYLETVKIHRTLIKVNPDLYLPGLAVSLNNLGLVHNEKDEMVWAEQEYREALDIRRALLKVDATRYLSDVSQSLLTLAILHQKKNEFVQAEKEYQEALNIRRTLAKTDPSRYLSDVAQTLIYLGDLHTDKNAFVQAEQAYEESLKIYTVLEEEAPSQYLPWIALALNNSALLYKEKNELTMAEQKFKEALEIRKSLAELNPFMNLSTVSETLNNLAIVHHAQKNLWQAEQEFKESLEIARSLASIKPYAYLHAVAATLGNLSVLHSDKNELIEAEQELQESLTIQRTLANSHPSVYLPNVALTLNNLASLHIAKKELVLAEQALKESVKLYKQLARANALVYSPKVAATLINLAAFYYQLKPDKAISIAYIKEAIPILDPFLKIAPYTQDYGRTAAWVLYQWGVNIEDLFDK